MLSPRTISGKLIVGLVVLLGLASVIVSVVTAQSLNNSLMSSLNQQLQSATHALVQLRPAKPARTTGDAGPQRRPAD